MVEGMSATGLLSAYLLDFLLGDPSWRFHPIRIMGNTIQLMEKWLRKIVQKERGEKWAGVLLCIVIVVLTYLFTWGCIHYACRLHRIFGSCVAIALAYFTISVKSLRDAARAIKTTLESGDEATARGKLALIVGRDTQDLTKKEIIRATVETVAENTNDGIVAPLFYLTIGGPPLGMAYKAINTLDSMVGYTTPKYLKLGWASARCDDVINFIPARLAGILMVLSAFLLRMDWRGALTALKKDARKHASPNSGYPEAAVAGALQVQLGGVNFYGGVKKVLPHLGLAKNELRENSIDEVISLMYCTSALMLLFCIVLSGVLP